MKTDVADIAAAAEEAFARRAVLGHVPNYGYLRINWDGPHFGRKTIFVAGAGPSEPAAILANALEQLGVCVARFPDGLRDEFGPAKADFSARHGTWAAHSPFSAKELRRAARTVSAPHFLLAFDDAASLAAGLESDSLDPAQALALAAKSTAEVALFAAETKAPIMAVSVRKAQEFADAHVEALALFAGVAIESAMSRQAAIEVLTHGTRALRAPSAVASIVRGGVNTRQPPGAITGWAKSPLSSAPVRVCAVHNGEKVGEVMASEFRQDLEAARIGDGRHGFTVAIDARHLSERPRRFEVFAMPDNQPLGAVELTRSGGNSISWHE